MRIATRQAFWEILAELWEKNEKIVVLDADLSWSTKTSSFAKKFPERFFNMWIAEADMIWTAAWLAIAWKVPVAASFAIFSTWRAWEQVRNTVCYSNLPVKIIWTHAWILTWEDWATHQSLEDIAILRSIPNITIIQPADAIETKSAFKKMIDHDWPVYFRLTRAWLPIIKDEKYEFNPWRNTILKTWKDVVIFATWATVYNSLVSAKKLEEDKISATVVNVSSLKPVDEENIKEMCSVHKMAFTVEDHSVIWWLWSIVSEIMAENAIACPLRKIWMRTFWESWTSEDLYAKYWLDSLWISEKVNEEFDKCC